MKKKLVVLLSLVLTISFMLCGCGKSEYVEVSGTQYKLKEIPTISEDNQIKFENDFWGKEVTIVGKVDEIGTGMHVNVEYDSYVDIGDWIIDTAGYEDVLADLEVGDTIRATGSIDFSGFGYVGIEATSFEIVK